MLGRENRRVISFISNEGNKETNSEDAREGNASENSRGGVYADVSSVSVLLNTKFAVNPSREVCVILKVGDGIRLGMRGFPSASCTVPISSQRSVTNPSSGIFRDGSTGSM